MLVFKNVKHGLFLGSNILCIKSNLLKQDLKYFCYKSFVCADRLVNSMTYQVTSTVWAAKVLKKITRILVMV